MRPEATFPFLYKNGNLGTKETAITNTRLKSTREWVSSLTHEEKTKYRITRDRVFTLLDVNSYDEIQEIIKDKARKTETSKKVYQLLGRMNGLDGSLDEIKSKIDDFAETADGIMHSLRNGIMNRFSSRLEMVNEIETTNNPTELLLILFNDRYHERARFEALRKLHLMSLAGSIYQREKETDSRTRFGMFLNFLDEFVWSPENKIGSVKNAFIISTHDKENNFICTQTEVFDEVNQRLKLEPNQKITELSRREFFLGNHKISTYSKMREKSRGAKVLKLMRKGLENPETAVDDEMGLIGVFENERDMDLFRIKLQKSAKEARTDIALEEISDTLNGGEYVTTNIGSSNHIKLRKFFVRLGLNNLDKNITVLRLEFILFTPQSYVNSLYQENLSHEEYEIKRLFDSGIMDLLFPTEIYGINIPLVRNFLLRETRRRIEQPQRIISNIIY